MFTIRFTICLLAMAMGVNAVLAYEFRSFKSSDGVEIKARLISYSKKKGVSIIMDDGRPFDVPLERFSKEDQKYILEWHKTNADLLTENSDMDVFVGTKKSKKGLGSSAYGQTQVETIEPSVRITNKEWTDDFRGVNGILAIVARDVTSTGRYMVLSVEEFSFDNIPQGGSREWQGKQVQTSWYDDDGDGYDNSSGFRYKGYVIVLKNRNGEQVYTKGTRSSWEGSYEKIKNLKTNYIYDDDLRGGG